MPFCAVSVFSTAVKGLSGANEDRADFLGVDFFCDGFVCFKMFFVFQSGAVFLAICYIVKLKSLICVLFATFWS